MGNKYIQLLASDGTKKDPFPNLSKIEALSGNGNESSSIVFFGDSVMNSISYRDTDRRGLHEIVFNKIKNDLNLLPISAPGYNTKVYYYFLKALDKANTDYKKIIVPINLRSFSPQWYANPRYQFDYEISALNVFCRTGKQQPIFIDPKKYHSMIYKRKYAYENMIVGYDDTSINKVGHFEKIKTFKPGSDRKMIIARLKQIFIFHYMNQLTPNHELIQFLKKMVLYLDTTDIKIIIYITPINYLAGNLFVGDHFTQSIKFNVHKIKTVIDDMNTTANYRFMDCSTLLGRKYFHNLTIANEHLNQEGRHFLSERIAKLL